MSRNRKSTIALYVFGQEAPFSFQSKSPLVSFSCSLESDSACDSSSFSKFISSSTLEEEKPSLLSDCPPTVVDLTVGPYPSIAYKSEPKPFNFTSISPSHTSRFPSSHPPTPRGVTFTLGGPGVKGVLDREKFSAFIVAESKREAKRKEKRAREEETERLWNDSLKFLKDEKIQRIVFSSIFFNCRGTVSAGEKMDKQLTEIFLCLRPSLIELEIQNTRFWEGDEALYLLMLSVACLVHLKRLSLGFINLHYWKKVSLSKFLKIVGLLEHLEFLSVSNCFGCLGNSHSLVEPAKTISSSHCWPSILEFHLSLSCFSSLSFVPSLPKLQTLKLIGDIRFWTNRESFELIWIQNQTSLHTLILEQIYVTQTCAEQLASACKHLPHLQNLTFRSCSFGLNQLHVCKTFSPFSVPQNWTFEGGPWETDRPSSLPLSLGHLTLSELPPFTKASYAKLFSLLRNIKTLGILTLRKLKFPFDKDTVSTDIDLLRKSYSKDFQSRIEECKFLK